MDIATLVLVVILLFTSAHNAAKTDEVEKKVQGLSMSQEAIKECEKAESSCLYVMGEVKKARSEAERIKDRCDSLEKITDFDRRLSE